MKWWTAILIGLLIGTILSMLVSNSHENATRAYLAEHHCKEKGKQTKVDKDFPLASIETTYVCDGGEVFVVSGGMR